MPSHRGPRSSLSGPDAGTRGPACAGAPCRVPHPWQTPSDAPSPKTRRGPGHTVAMSAPTRRTHPLWRGATLSTVEREPKAMNSTTKKGEPAHNHTRTYKRCQRRQPSPEHALTRAQANLTRLHIFPCAIEEDAVGMPDGAHQTAARPEVIPWPRKHRRLANTRHILNLAPKVFRQRAIHLKNSGLEGRAGAVLPPSPPFVSPPTAKLTLSFFTATSRSWYFARHTSPKVPRSAPSMRICISNSSGWI